MKQELEIEFKNIVSKNHFQTLMNHFNITKENLKEQTNHYFDTSSFSLKAQRSALRIRKKEDSYVLTLKQPSGQHLLESNQPISKETLEQMLASDSFPDGGIKELIQSMGIDPELIQYLGTLKTFRAKIPYDGGLLFFDESHYLGTIDYEIEYECDDDKKGKETFKALMTSHSIPIVKTANKIQRFFTRKQDI
ncbi:CYTH domain-containing protein [Fictibacillus aquaticus]|uniref:CYTH domain-containing protein n=1 Tax=Fictibacillus aquaticus TaxID=2021314 RepID=UPI0013FD8695|nr:CYTH domain-containing protein [Fictibacillus aquaticus]